jgi:translation initiation factor 1
MVDRDRLVYSTETGRVPQVCPKCHAKVCRCPPEQSTAPGPQTARIQRESKGRAGKTVTTVSGLHLKAAELAELGSMLRRRCSTGGTTKDDTIEIQGDQREAVAVILRELGYKIKLVGG